MAVEITRRAATAGLAAVGAYASGKPPKRIVSLGQCLDPILLAVADRAQIAAITHYSRDPQTSTIWHAARTLPVTAETAEEVIALQPDLVLASRRSGLQARLALKHLGVRVEEFEVPDTIKSSLAQIQRIGRLVGHEDRANALTRQVEASLTRAAAPSGTPKLAALIYEGGGLVAGRKTLISEAMERCGLENVAERYGVTNWGVLPLERLLADPPQVLLVGNDPGRAGERVMNHPALAMLEPRMHRITFPARLLYCGGPVLMQTSAALAQARRETSALRARV